MAAQELPVQRLAYVKMSRARQRSVVHVVADSVDQAVEDLTRDWAVKRRPRWAIDTAAPVIAASGFEANRDAPPRAAVRRSRLRAERSAVLAAIPPDPGPALRRVEARLEELRQATAELAEGRGAYADKPVGEAARVLLRAHAKRKEAEGFAVRPDIGWMRRFWGGNARHWAHNEALARASWEGLSAPESARLTAETHHREADRQDLRDKQAERQAWLTAHPEAARRLERLERELSALDDKRRSQRPLERLDQHAVGPRPPGGRTGLGRTISL